MRIFILISSILFSFAIQEGIAQPDYEFIYADSASKQDSIIDFGATIPGVQLFKTVTIKNTTDDTLWVPAGIAEYYCKCPSASGDETYNEFEALQDGGSELGFPVIVPPKNDFTITIRFDSDLTGPQSATGEKTALLKINLLNKRTDTEIASRIFFLTVIKTEKLLVSKIPAVDFGLVYINSSVLKTWTVINAAPNVFNAQQTLTQATTPGNEFFALDTLRTVSGGPSKYIPLRFQYAPMNRGSDTARLEMRSPSLKGVGSDTVSALFTGYGVEQNLEFVQATTDNVTQTPLNDTVNIGNLRVGVASKVTLEFKNRGNIYFRAVDDETAPIDNSTQVTIQRSFPTVPLDTGLSQTAELVVNPQEIGTQTIRYSIDSDIASRVWGVPQYALRRTVYIRFQGVEPRLSAAGSINFDSLEVLDCQLRTSRNIVISNTGNIPLSIEPPVLKPGSGNFVFVNPVSQPVQIQPGGNFVFKIDFMPNTTGFKSETLVIANNSSQPVKNIILEGEGIEPKALQLSLPQDIRVMPGTVIRVPIIGDAELFTRASTYEGTVDYDETLLRPHPDFIITQNTASEGAAVSFDETTKMIRIVSSVGFNRRDTLAFLQFNTFLGNSLETNIAIPEQSVKVGVANCASIVKSVSVQNGRVVLDSACGLAFKIGNGGGQFRFEQSVPFPAVERSEIEYEVAFPTRVVITLYDSYGRAVERIVDEEQPKGTFKVAVSMSGRTPGAYFCEMRAGIYSAVRQIIVAE